MRCAPQFLVLSLFDLSAGKSTPTSRASDRPRLRFANSIGSLNETAFIWHSMTAMLLPGPVSAGYYHTCGVRDTGAVVCWGNDDDGQSTPPADTLVSVSAGISAGGFHTCETRTTGAVVCWGLDGDGQSTPPTGVFASVSAGGYHTCGVRASGAVECWGWDSDGQATPLASTFTSVGAGTWHTCGVRNTGTVECWGWTAMVRPHHQRACLRRSVPGLGIPAGCVTRAPWNAGAGTATVSPAHQWARSLP